MKLFSRVSLAVVSATLLALVGTPVFAGENMFVSPHVDDHQLSYSTVKEFIETFTVVKRNDPKHSQFELTRYYYGVNSSSQVWDIEIDAVPYVSEKNVRAFAGVSRDSTVWSIILNWFDTTLLLEDLTETSTNSGLITSVPVIVKIHLEFLNHSNDAILNQSIAADAGEMLNDSVHTQVPVHIKGRLHMEGCSGDTLDKLKEGMKNIIFYVESVTPVLNQEK